MLSRCKGKNVTNCVRCIAIPASPSTFSRIRSVTERQETSKNEEEEVWNNVLKAIPTSSKWQSTPGQRRRNELDSDFFSSRRLGQSRKYTTDAKQGDGARPSPEEPETIFNSSRDPWDHVFDNIGDQPPLSSLPYAARPRATTQQPSNLPRARAQAMTAREISAFNEMFNMIFEAASRKDSTPAGPEAEADTKERERPRTAADRRAEKAARHDPLTGVGIGSGPEGVSGMGDLLGKLRRVSRRFRWSEREDAELEQKLAQMELCDTDQQLLEWAAREVFEESARYEEAARQAVVRAESSTSTSTTNSSKPTSDSQPEPEPNPEPEQSQSNRTSDSSPSPSSSSSSSSSPLPLQPPAYPHLLAHLMRTFRDKFHDPHLSLSIFTHARSRSIASFVFGCTVPVYNELLRTRWDAFRDLRGVADALREMRVNGIAPDAKTRELVEQLRRDVGARTVWQEERNIGTGEVLELLTEIETLGREPLKNDSDRRKGARKGQGHGQGQGQGKKKWKRWRTSVDEQWKTSDGRSDKRYKFGDWEFGGRAKKTRRDTPDHSSRTPSHSESNSLAFE